MLIRRKAVRSKREGVLFSKYP